MDQARSSSPGGTAGLERLADAYRGRRVVVLGASGFIGRQVALTLSGLGAEVVRAQRRTDGAVPEEREEGPRVERLDAEHPAALRNLLESVRPAVTFNLIGYGVDRSERDRAAAWAINADFPHRLVHPVAQYADPTWSGRPLVHVGSALEYGTAPGDLTETTRGRPTTLYGRSKLLGTYRLLRAARRHEVSALVARLFTVFGPGEHPGRLLPSLIETANTGRPLLLTDGLQRRDFTYVGDVAAGLARLATTAPGPPEVVNLATGKLMSVREFALSAARLLRLQDGLLRFGALPTRPEEMRHDPVNIGRLRALVRWVPPTTVGEGLWHTLQGAGPSVVGTLQRPRPRGPEPG